MAVGAIVARILTQYSNKGSKAAQKDIVALQKKFDAFGKKSARAFGIATAASAAFAVKIGKDAVQAAIADQKSQALLANTLRNTTGATEGAITGVESYITSLQKQFNVVDDDLRPAMARLVGATGSVEAAQGLMQTSLDVSAKSGADLATSVGAVIKATSGQFKALKNLVPELSNATIKSKDVAKAFEEVNKASSGAASTRAGTLEYRLKGLQIAFGEILETLGYALLPVMEKFASVISTKILPQLEAFITTNKDKIATSFKLAAEFAVQFLAALISIGDWIANNTGKVKAIAAAFALMFVVTKVYSMITAINLLTAALVRMNVAMGAGAIGAVTKGAAKGGMLATLGVALAAGNVGGKIGGGIAGLIPGTKANRLKNSVKAFGTSPMSPSPSDLLSGKFAGGSAPSIGGTDALSAFLDALNKNTTAVKKNTKTVFDIATENAQKELAARQKALSGSASIAIGGGGKMYGTRNAQGGIQVNVNAGAVVGSTDALIEVVKNGLETVTRRNGGGGPGGSRYAAMVAL
jgi:hypothetical protein